MKRALSAMTVALGLAFGATGAQADYLFDGFGNAQVPIVDDAIDATIVTSSYIAVTDTDISNLYRRLATSLTGGVPGLDQIRAQVGGGFFSSSQTAPNALGFSTVDWIINADGSGTADLSAWQTLALAVKVAFADQGNGAIRFFLVDADGTSINTIISIAGPVSFSNQQTFTRNFADFVQVDAGTTAGFDWSNFKQAALTIDGQTIPALDVTIDIISAVPEPGSLLLFGAALAGMGLVARRRKPE